MHGATRRKTPKVLRYSGHRGLNINQILLNLYHVVPWDPNIHSGAIATNPPNFYSFKKSSY